MDIEVEELGNDGVIVRVRENITFANVKEFSKLTQDLIDNGKKKVLLDLERVSFCNSHGFSVIINLYTRLAKRDGRFAIVKPQKAILDVLEITKMDSIIGVYDDEGQALNAVSV